MLRSSAFRSGTLQPGLRAYDRVYDQNMLLEKALFLTFNQVSLFINRRHKDTSVILPRFQVCNKLHVRLISHGSLNQPVSLNYLSVKLLGINFSP